MAEDEKNSANENFPDSSDQASFGETHNPVSNTDQPTDGIQIYSSQNSNPNPNIVVNPQNDNTSLLEAQRANRFTKTGLIINTLLLLGTLGALGITWYSIDVTKQSVDISKQALNDSRKKDSVAAMREGMIDSLDRIRRGQDFAIDTTNTGLTKQSLEEQINSLRETQKRFEIENRPLIQVGNLTIDTIPKDNVFKDKYAVVNYYLINMGRFPAKILSGTGDVLYGGDMSVEDIEKKQKVSFHTYNASVSNATVLPATQNVLITDETWKQYKEGKVFFYVIGEDKYMSMVTNKVYSYSYIYKLVGYPRYAVVGLKNEDKSF